MKSDNFQLGKGYSRSDIYGILSVPEEFRGGDWHTGYRLWGETFFVFCNLGISGRTGHDYDNQLVGKYLHWYAKNGSRLFHRQIQLLLSPDTEVLIFGRSEDRAPFDFLGAAEPLSYQDATDELPVFVLWGLG
jgi:5-methylcytosine-specific restriction protein A